MRTVIFANGQVHNLHAAWNYCQPADLIIAADGGWHHLQTLQIKADVVIGDFDSITPQELKSIQAQGIKTIQHPQRKNETDLELALSYAVENGSSQIILIGGLGARWDQTIANVLLITHKKFQSIPISLIDSNQIIFTISAPARTTAQIEGRAGDTVSLIPLLGDVHGISTHGLEYPLKNETLFYGSTRGISNVLLQSPATVTIQSGVLMIVIIHHSTIPYQEVQND